MVAVAINPQRLSARDDFNGIESGEWGTFQIIAPIIVGVGLLLLFAAYITWRGRPHDKRTYGYQQVRSDWITKFGRVFVSRRKRVRVLRSSAPVTIDDSMPASEFAVGPNHRSRQSRSNSSDSQTPLTSGNPAFDYPPVMPLDWPPNEHSDSPPPHPKRRTVRWWWFFGSRPRQIKSEEPGHQWQVDDPDGSSSGHGHSSHGHRYTGALEPLREHPEDGDDEVIRIGENFSNIELTSVAQHSPEPTPSVHGIPTVPEHPRSGTHTPVPVVSAPQNNSSTSIPVSHGLPPSYDVSQSHARYPSAEDVRLARSRPYMTIPPPPVRAAGYPSFHTFHGRDLSSDSFLASQTPMVTTWMY